MPDQTRTWRRCGRVVALVLAAATLCGCELALPLANPAPRKIALFDGALTVAAPKGYCVDTASSQLSEDGAVILIGRCREDEKLPAAILTVTVGGAGSAGVIAAGTEALSTFFASDAGRATLARSGKAEDAHMLEALGIDDAFVMRIDDSEMGQYWRAITGLRGRLLTISASAAPDRELTPDDGRSLIELTLVTLIKANRDGPTTLAGALGLG